MPSSKLPALGYYSFHYISLLPYAVSSKNAAIASSKYLTSTLFNPGPPAKCPQMEGITSSFAPGIAATSISLSSG